MAGPARAATAALERLVPAEVVDGDAPPPALAEVPLLCDAVADSVPAGA